MFDFRFYLALARDNPVMADDLERIWMAGALLTLGDALTDQKYFGRKVPELELVRHLRNGIAHGNRFDIRYPGELKDYPAHNKLAWHKGPNKQEFEISPALNDQPVLFDFMSAGDILDLFYSVEVYLLRKGTGEPTRP